MWSWKETSVQAFDSYAFPTDEHTRSLDPMTALMCIEDLMEIPNTRKISGLTVSRGFAFGPHHSH